MQFDLWCQGDLNYVIQQIYIAQVLPYVIEEKDHNAIVKGRCCFYRSPTTEAIVWSENMDILLTNQGKIQ